MADLKSEFKDMVKVPLKEFIDKVINSQDIKRVYDLLITTKVVENKSFKDFMLDVLDEICHELHKEK